MSSATLTMDAAEPSRPAINPWIIALAVTLATFMEVLDTSIANVALPHIAGSLSAGTDESTWVLTSYLVSNAIVLPLSGWITDNYTWRWIFFVNIPVGIISLLLTSRLIQDPPHLRRRKLSEMKIDYVGLGFVALGLGTLQIILDKGQRDDWFESHFILALSIISAASLLFVIWWEWRQKDPVIDLHLVREQTFAAANFLMFMLGFALLGSTLLLPLFMQTLLGYTAQQAGMALSPGGFTIMVLMPIVGFMLTRYDARRLMIFGLAVLSFSLFHMTGFDP